MLQMANSRDITNHHHHWAIFYSVDASWPRPQQLPVLSRLSASEHHRSDSAAHVALPTTAVTATSTTESWLLHFHIMSYIYHTLKTPSLFYNKLSCYKQTTRHHASYENSQKNFSMTHTNKNNGDNRVQPEQVLLCEDLQCSKVDPFPAQDQCVSYQTPQSSTCWSLSSQTPSIFYIYM